MKQKILLQYYKLLAFFAKKYLQKHNPIIIGINGSVGKTSCRAIIHQTLQHYFPDQKIYTSSKNFNGELGLPLSVFCKESRTPNIWEFIRTLFNFAYQSLFAKKKYDVIILEYGIDRPGEMDFLLNIAKPDIGVFTALDAVHSEQFGDPNAIAEEEVKMPLNTKEVVFLNNDEPYTHQIINSIKIDKLTYQTTGAKPNANITFQNSHIINNTENNNIANSFELTIGKKNHSITTNQIGKINHGYIGVALAITEILAHKFQKNNPLQKEITLNYTLLPGRMTLFAGVEESIILDSTYNASPLSMRRLIDTTHQIKQSFLFNKDNEQNKNKKNKQVRLALGDMRELGDFTEKEHRLLAGYCQGIADKMFLVGESMKNYFLDEAEKIGCDMKTIQHFKNSKLLGNAMKTALEKLSLKSKEYNQENKSPLKRGNPANARRGIGNSEEVIILCKGSQNTIFLEEAVKILLKNKADSKHLVRQSEFWLSKKK
ncbi:MAG: hypothetical protein CR971_01475 [candidate division SR1 bacterium]|nr:MAG: hypothetical protein CR971_01475 [candidate division SR1 bacterium]